MTFSNVSSFNSTYKALSAANIAKESSNTIKKGGAFSPNFAEATSIMRASFDNQWENAYIIKYQALMQNRLNALKQELTAAYNNLLQQATSQQIRENGSNNAVSATTDVYGRMLPGAAATTTITGGPYPATTTTSFTVVNSTGFYVDDSITIGNNTYSVTNVSGNTISIDPPLVTAAAAGNVATGGRNEAFKGLKYYADAASINLADTNGVWDTPGGAGNSATEADGVPSYYLNTQTYQYNNAGAKVVTPSGNENVEMRKLYVAGPAMQVANDLKVTFRSEEVVPKATDAVTFFGGIFGGPPNPNPNFVAGEKVAEYSTEVKTGGFWSTVNYLYDFSPRELKYAYATSYSTTTEESGTRNYTDAVGKKQATLYSSKILDARDSQTLSGTYIQTDEDATPPALDAYTNLPALGARVKWTTSNPEDGYLTERNPLINLNNSNDANNVSRVAATSIDDRLITRRASDNDTDFPFLSTGFNSFEDTVKGDATDPWTGFKNSTSVPGDQQANDVKIWGTEEGGVTSMDTRIKWEYQHDGVAVVDTNRDAEINSSDATHVAVAAYINHYQVAVQQVELNSNPDSYGRVLALGHTRVNSNVADSNPYDDAADPMNAVATKVIRSGGIDASLDHVFSDVDNQYDAQGKLIHQNSVDKDGNGQSTNEKMMLPGSGKVSKNFTPKFVESLHQITSFNGQSLGAHGGNITISSENANSTPVVLGEYEGFKRAQSMSIGLAHDNYNDMGQQVRTYSDALALKNKLEAEVNASTMVDTDWHYSEYASSTGGSTLDGIMFRNVRKITYNDPDKGVGEFNVYYDGAIKDDPNSDTFQYVDPSTGISNSIQGTKDDTFNNVNVAFRKTFTLTRDQFQNLDYQQVNPLATNPIAPISPDAYTTNPTYKNRSVLIDIDTQNVDTDSLDLIVNGHIVTGVINAAVGKATYDIAPYLLEGDNVIASQMRIDKNVGLAGTGKAVAGNTGANDYFKLGSASAASISAYNTVSNSTLTANAILGTSTLSVADASVFHSNDTISVGGFSYSISSISTGSNQITLSSPLLAAAASGSVVGTAYTTNNTDIANWISGKISTTRTASGDVNSTELTNATNAGTMLSSWQSKIMANEVRPSLYESIYPSTISNPPGVDPAKFLVDEFTGQVTAEVNSASPTGYYIPGTTTQYNKTSNDIPMTEQAYNAYGSALMGLGSTKTATKVKDSNTFLKVLMEAMNKKEYQDIFALGLLNTSLGKDMTIKGQMSSPSGGTVQSILTIKYDNINNKFSLVQTKWDASGAPQQS